MNKTPGNTTKCENDHVNFITSSPNPHLHYPFNLNAAYCTLSAWSLQSDLLNERTFKEFCNIKKLEIWKQICDLNKKKQFQAISFTLIW